VAGGGRRAAAAQSTPATFPQPLSGCPGLPYRLVHHSTSPARARPLPAPVSPPTDGTAVLLATDQNHSFQLLYVLSLFAQHLRAPSVAFNSISTVLATVLRCSSSGEPSCYRCSCLLPHIDIGIGTHVGLLFAGMVAVVLMLKTHVRAFSTAHQYFILNKMMLVIINTVFSDYWGRCSNRSSIISLNIRVHLPPPWIHDDHGRRSKAFREYVFHRSPSHLRRASQEREVTVRGGSQLLGLPLYLR
jgi:hypothetical protein